MGPGPIHWNDHAMFAWVGKCGFLSLAFLMVVAGAELRMPAIFGDHMVLQQGVRVPVWGWAGAGESITVTIAGQRASATTGVDGKWMVQIGPLVQSDEVVDLTISSTRTIVFKDVLVGEVWVCSGQSNMEWPLSATFSKSEVPKASHPRIRLFKVEHRVAFDPLDDCRGTWVVCTPETAAGFSGVGYFFGKEIHRTVSLPVGLIGSHWGGTPAQSWTRLEGLRSQAPLSSFVDAFRSLRERREQIETEYAQKTLPAHEAAMKQWEADHKRPHDAACRQWEEDVRKAKAAGQPLPAKPVLKQPPPPKYECRTQRADNPTVLYNGMIAPLIPFAIKGVIWYQGESNASSPGLYRTLFPTLIRDWRACWGQGDFPFLFVQLCSGAGDDARIPLMREAQASALMLAQTGMAVTYDVGEPQMPQIHPRNKRDVGLRLALAARRIAYGQDVCHSGPTYGSMAVDADVVRITFANIGKGLVIGVPPVAKEGDVPGLPRSELSGFSIAGEDRTFVPAEAHIAGSCVMVRSRRVTRPVAVRYAWASFPDANLYNQDGLPAAPFRTDDWGGL